MTPVLVGNGVSDDVLEINSASGTCEAASSAVGNVRVLAASANLRAIAIQLGLKLVRCGEGTCGAAVEPPDEELFAGLAKKGTQKADWIDAGSTYEFRLYEGKAHKKVLRSVTVTRISAKK